MSAHLEAILADDYLGDVTSVTLETLREQRAECTSVETGLSYLRRLVQGRLDVVQAEQTRRAEGGRPDDLEDLIARLPSLLAESTRAPGLGRLPHDFGTGEADADLQAELDAIVSGSHLAEPDLLADADLAAAAEQLRGFERKVSDLRRALFDRIDAIEAELTRRYRTGEASIDTLLR